MKRHRSGSGDYDRKRRHHDANANQYSESRSGSDASAEDDEVGHLNVRPGDFIGERCASQSRAGGRADERDSNPVWESWFATDLAFNTQRRQQEHAQEATARSVLLRRVQGARLQGALTTGACP